MPESVSCGKTTPGIGPVRPTESVQADLTEERRRPVMTARVGRVAPDFKAEAYEKGGFKAYQLSEFRGKWVLLCFYPGDFTFV